MFDPTTSRHHSESPIEQLHSRHGHRWRIERDLSLDAWFGTIRPTRTSLRVIAARTPAELLLKLAVAEARYLLAAPVELDSSDDKSPP